MVRVRYAPSRERKKIKNVRYARFCMLYLSLVHGRILLTVMAALCAEVGSDRERQTLENLSRRMMDTLFRVNHEVNN